MNTNVSQPTEIEAMAAAHKSRVREAEQQRSEASRGKEQADLAAASGPARKFNTIEGEWVDFDPQAPESKGKPVTSRKHLTISRNQQGRFYATLHDPRNFLRLEEFRATDREYWMVAATKGRKRIYRFYGMVSEDGLSMKGRFTVYTPDGLIARKMAIKQHRAQ